jgi:hypothetical protein
MTGSELGLLGIITTCLAVYRLVFRQDLRCLAAVFVMGCVWGAIAQPFLGARMNLYTTNVSWYVGYVSVAVVLTWGIGLTSVYSAHLLLARFLGTVPRFRHYAIVSAPVVTTLEVVGSNVIHVKLHDHTTYAALVPMLNAMNAPAWLYLFYLVVGAAFYAPILACRLDSGVWRDSVLAGGKPRLRRLRVPGMAMFAGPWRFKGSQD